MAIFFSDIDKDLIRPSVGRDPLGLQPIWTTRARDIVPHLTAQTSRIEGFQVLLTIYALWTQFQEANDLSDKQLEQFYLLTEQVIARSSYVINGVWPLPGRRRLLAGDSKLIVSLSDHNFHLSQNQMSSGTWGLYRGAAERAGLLDIANRRIAAPYLKAAAPLPASIVQKLFKVIKEALSAPEAQIPIYGGKKGELAVAMAQLVERPPLISLLRDPLLFPTNNPLTGELATILANKTDWDYRPLIAQLIERLPGHRETLNHLLSCEQWLAPVEGIFDWLCAHSGFSLHEAALKLPVDLFVLRRFRTAFLHSGNYDGKAASRQNLYAGLDLTDKASLISSLLAAHKAVAEEKEAGPWIGFDENERLDVRVSMDAPNKGELDPATAWRNDYYLSAFWRISRQVIKGIRDEGDSSDDQDS